MNKLPISDKLKKHLTPQELEIANNCPYNLEDIKQIAKYLEPLTRDALLGFLAGAVLAMSAAEGLDPIEVACRYVNLADIAAKQ